MNIHHDSARDYLSIDFADEIEAKSVYEDGIVVRYDKAGHVIGIDITDSMKLFGGSDLLTLREVCDFLGGLGVDRPPQDQGEQDQAHHGRQPV